MGKRKQEMKSSTDPVVRAEAALKAAEKAMKSWQTRTVAALRNFHHEVNSSFDDIDQRRCPDLALKDAIEKKQAEARTLPVLVEMNIAA
jgi:hypothetical protein